MKVLSKNVLRTVHSGFVSYDRYKDSGIEWIGEVPEHWEVRRNLGVFDERKECNQPEEELLSVTVSRGIIRQSEITAKKDSSNDDKSKYKVVRVGDLAYNKMRAWQGALGISEFNGIVSPAYVVLTPRNKTLSKYFHYLYRTPQFITEANRLSYGLCDDMNSLRYEHFKTSYSPLPPDDEIDRIVAFLDQKTAEIDILIAKKQRQIELLDEQKAIIINRAVTRGLNPKAKLKPSGIEWIGEIPEHWETRQVRHLFDNLDNRRIPISSIERGKMTERLYDYYGASGAIDKVDGYIFDEDLILIAEDGANLVMRNLPLAIHATGKYWVNNHAHILRTKQGPIEYWLHALECCDFTTSITGSAQPKLTKDALASRFLPCPPVNEQHAIVAFLNQNREAEEKLRATIAAQSASLQTLRSTLIAHAVTGRIKI
jgi:type I restriction enzyme S subunit